MTHKELQAKTSDLAEDLNVPGVAVGVLHDGEERHAFHGITSIENPLPVDESTLFQFGSTGKTYTATAIMRLVEEGKVALDASVRTYVPELKLADEDVARTVTVLHLLNHTAGWSGDLLDKTGDGDDALARYVELMAGLEQVTPLGKTVSYNNASLSLAGRIIEKITGKTYEQAIKEMVFEPLGMEHSFFFPNEIMTRRFVAGHHQEDDGTIKVTRPWALPRGGNPAGGISSNSGDMIKWARFHLGDGKGKDGTQLLSKASLDLMKEATADTRGGAIGDYIGISWMLRDVEGVRLVGHGGDTVGQHSDFFMVPERNFAMSVMTNCGPNGSQLIERLNKWALESYLGLVDRDPEPIKLDDAALAQYVGTYETIAGILHVTAADGGLLVKAEIKPGVWEQISDDPEPPDEPPLPLGMLEGPGDRYIVSDGPAKGMKGYFARNESGEIESMHVGGRLADRVREPASA
jgi:CubicO group peptidase (beta-lactamase class C family)